MQTFINLPDTISKIVNTLLQSSTKQAIWSSATRLHERYMDTQNIKGAQKIRNQNDALAYLSLRFPATFAQISSALLQLQERIPHWNPKTVLDVGSGPGTGILAARLLWPQITNATAIEEQQVFLTIGQRIFLPLPEITSVWHKQSITEWITKDSQTYDLVIIANVYNELDNQTKNALINKLCAAKNSVVLILEPGTAHGFKIIQSIAQNITFPQNIIAPYINNTFRQSDAYWIHFTQRFIRPDFMRHVRQQMRENNSIASDWEAATYCYLAFGQITPAHQPFGVTIGPVEKYHGYLEIPVLTQKGVEKIKIMKRHKQQYTFAKNLKWGDAYENQH